MPKKTKKSKPSPKPAPQTPSQKGAEPNAFDDLVKQLSTSAPLTPPFQPENEKQDKPFESKEPSARILCIGCGTGQAQLLNGLASCDYYLSSIIGVTDNGGHSGLLRKILGIPPVGDARNCLASLSLNDSAMAKLIKFRFSDSSMGGISMGNLVLAALTVTEQKFSRAINALRKTLGIHQRVIPVSDYTTDVCASLEDERTIVGEWEIIDRSPRSPIKKIFLKDRIPLHPIAEEEILNADYIIFSPGSLMTGILSIIQTHGIQQALKNSKSKKIFVCNIMTQPGQTDGFTAAQHLDELLKYLPSPIDFFLVNTKQPNSRLLAIYEKEGYEFVKKGNTTGIKTITGDFVESLSASTVSEKIKDFKSHANMGFRRGLHLIRHDPEKTATAIVKLIKSDKSEK